MKACVTCFIDRIPEGTTVDNLVSAEKCECPNHLKPDNIIGLAH